MSGEARDLDRDLIRRYRDGDEEAFRVLIERHLPELQARIRQRLPARLERRVAVSDVLQEASLVAHRRRASFQPDGPDAFRNWLLGIIDLKAREAIRFHHRSAKRDQQRELTRGQRAGLEEMRAHETTPSQHAIAGETAARAREALASLGPDDREVLRLSRELHLPLRDVARRMDRSYEAAKKLYARALVRFKRAFDERGGAE